MKTVGRTTPGTLDLGDRYTLVEEEKAVDLLCGHSTRSVSVVTYANGRKAYYCPEGCGIQKAKR